MKRTRLDIYDDFSNSQIDAVINEWIHKELYRQVLHYKLVDGYTYEHIAELVDRTPKRVQDIVYAAEDKLYKHLIINKP